MALTKLNINEWSNYMLRSQVYMMFSCWDDKPRGSLSQLLGYDGVEIMVRNFNERDRDICAMLLGPNGKTIYHMLKVRQCHE